MSHSTALSATVLTFALACARQDVGPPGSTAVDGTRETDTQPASDGSPLQDNDGSAIDADAMAADRDPTLHLFLLLGQSNMAGYALAAESDMATDDRIQMLGFDDRCGRANNEWALARPSLHDFINGCSAKVSPGDWFAKTLIERLPEGDSIGLVPAAFSGERIEAFLQGGSRHDTIIAKIEEASTATSARFSGILFHQGESNNGEASWPGKVKTLYEQVKEAMGLDEDIPFLAGELPYAGDAASHNARVAALPAQGANFFVVSAEGLNVDPADLQWNLHFGHDDTVELGKRYAATMADALEW